ncbi:hypothetical protein ACIQLG_16765 [Terribacillus saccharophilus]|uniref:hypothetical protein n=1 Tax=Terribacillus saccharophilus TaxID=361277 RepID=UPI003824F82C
MISCSEVDAINQDTLVVPFERDKSHYLFNYILVNNLGDRVKVQPNRSQFKIKLSGSAKTIRDQLYTQGDKVFTKLFGTDVLNHKSLIVTICLFGTRKIEGISVSTNVNKDYLKTLCYCAANILDHAITPGKGNWKISDVSSFYEKIIHRTTSLESSTIATYLNNNEKDYLSNKLDVGHWRTACEN